MCGLIPYTSTVQKLKFSFTDFFRKWEKVWIYLGIFSSLQEKSANDNFVLWSVLTYVIFIKK